MRLKISSAKFRPFCFGLDVSIVHTKQFHDVFVCAYVRADVWESERALFHALDFCH